MSAEVGGREVYFASGTELEPAPEAFLSAFLLPAMARGDDLHIDAPVCETWLENVAVVREWARRWWSFSGGEIACAGSHRSEAQSEDGALFFGGGVDSCFALHQERDRLSCLINTEGFDIKLADGERLARARRLNQNVADACELELVTLRTNLRQHPALKRLHWLKQYGAANVATGHVLSRRCCHVLLSGWGLVTSRTRGSHPEIDAQWSSGAISFEHHGETHSRGGKVEVIADWPIVQRHIRVCYEHRSERLNCGACEKCVRTRLEFLAAGRFAEMTAFPPSPLPPLIDGIPGLAEHVAYNYQELADAIDDPELRAAIARLLERSPRWRARKKRYRNLKRGLRELVGLRK